MKSKRLSPTLTLLAIGSLWLLADCGRAAQQLPGSRPPSPASVAGWDTRAAATYLDERMDLWFENAQSIRTGQESASCISCHTVIPYAMARPVLRKAFGESTPTPQESRLLDNTLRRVATYADHEPFQGVPEQSRGIEAVLNAFILADDDALHGRREPSEPTRKALEELWKQQRPDGAWSWYDYQEEPYDTLDGAYFGAALAALAIGTLPGNVQGTDERAGNHEAALRQYLMEGLARQNLHNQAWVLLASTRLSGLLSRSQRQALIRTLISAQNPDGGWSLYKLGPWRWSEAVPPFAPPTPTDKPDLILLSKSDGYATGLIVYALREAGLPLEKPAVRRAVTWLKANQGDCRIDVKRWKCWRSYSLNYDREHGGKRGAAWPRMFMSDAATAFAVLALLPAESGRSGRHLDHSISHAESRSP